MIRHVEILPEQEDWVVWGQDLGHPRSLIYSDRNNIAPRIGFAWRPFSSRTVLRYGVGQFFGLSIINPIRGSLGVNPPFSIQEIHRRNDNNPFHLTWEDPFPLVSDIGDIESPQGYELHPPSGNLYQYNFTVEHQFGKGLVTEFGYVGSKGTHLGRRWNINQWSYLPGNCDGIVFAGSIGNVCKESADGDPPGPPGYKTDSTGQFGIGSRLRQYQLLSFRGGLELPRIPGQCEKARPGHEHAPQLHAFEVDRRF